MNFHMTRSYTTTIVFGLCLPRLYVNHFSAILQDKLLKEPGTVFAAVSSSMWYFLYVGHLKHVL